MGERKATLTAVLVDAVSGPAKTIKAEINGIGSEAGKVTQILRGIGQGIGQQLERGFAEGIRAITDIIPSLIGRGNEYLDQLYQIQLETGMSAEQTSTLVGALRALGVPTDDITTLMARLGANIGRNEGLFRQLGIATRDSDGNLLNSYVIFQNIRRAVQEHGESLLSTAAAQEIFGRSGFKIIEALQTSDSAWQAATDNVRRWGGVVSQSAIDGADRLGDTIASLQQGITDVGVNIAAAVDPYLRAFVDSFASFVQSHLNEIVNFAVAVVNTVTGFFSGIFGITSALSVTSDQVASSTNRAGAATDNFGKVMKSAAGGSDAFTNSVNAQIKAIDAHIAALEQASERRRAAEQRARLTESLRDAQGQLADLRGNAPFVAGLSNAEQQLAIQKHAQDIIDAERNVADKRQALGDFEADQKDRAERELLNRQRSRLQELLAANRQTNAAITQSGLKMGEGLEANAGKVLGNLGIKAQQFGETARTAFQNGINAGRGFLDILLGSETELAHGNGTVRTGGIVGALGRVGDAFGGIVSAVSTMVGWLNALGDGLNTLNRWLTDLSFTIHDFLVKNLVGSGTKGGSEFFGVDGFNKGFYGGGKQNARGGVFDTLAPTRIGNGIMGEAGGETVAIIANPRVAATSGGNVINIHFESVWPPTTQQGREIVDYIDRAFGIRTGNAAVGARGRV